MTSLGPESFAFRVNDARSVEVGGREYRMVIANAAVVEMGDLPKAIVNRIAVTGQATASDVINSLKDKAPSHTVLEALDECLALELLLPASGNGNGNGNSPAASDSAAPQSPTFAEPPGDLGQMASLTLHVSHTCNMKCGYCYAEHGLYGGEAGLMSMETAQEFVDTLFERSADAPYVSIQFFGGEPLLNWKVVHGAAEYAIREAQVRGKKVRFGITTNGLLLDYKKAEYLSSRGFVLTVSIDGPPDINDAHRSTSSGKPTYDKIMEVTPLLKMFPRAGARVTVTHKSLEVERIVNHLVESGFREVGVSNVTSTDPDFALTEEDHQVLVGEFRKLTAKFVEEAREGRVFGFSNIRNLIAQIHEGAARSHPCGAGIRLFAGTPDGDMFLCHRFAGQKDFKMGSLESGGPDAKIQASMLAELDVRSKSQCETCWLRTLCAGGCYYVPHSSIGDACGVDEALCPWLREWFQLGLETYILLSQETPEFLSRLLGEPETCFV